LLYFSIIVFLATTRTKESVTGSKQGVILILRWPWTALQTSVRRHVPHRW